MSTPWKVTINNGNAELSFAYPSEEIAKAVFLSHVSMVLEDCNQADPSWSEPVAEAAMKAWEDRFFDYGRMHEFVKAEAILGEHP